jgi:hypothetical protein
MVCGATARWIPADEPAEHGIAIPGAGKEPTKLRQRQAIDAAVNDKLRKEIDIDVIETPFSDVCKDLDKSIGVTIVLDPEGLEEAGVTPDQLISMNLKSISAASALNILLGPLHLHHVARDGVLQITSQQRLQRDFLTLRVFDVRDLTEKSITASKPLPILRKTDGAAALLLGGTAALKPPAEAPALPAIDPQTPSDHLLSLVCDSIAPQTWTHRGGYGTARVFAGTLLVRQTDENLDDISDLLEEIRRIINNAPGAAD